MLTVISDTHLGVKRQSGTTPSSAEELTQFMRQKFSELLKEADGGDLLINGDLFDRFDVDKETEYFVFRELADWVKRNPGNKLLLSAGNHDLSRVSTATSSFDNLCNYLEMFGWAVCVNGYVHISTGQYAIVPHFANQELFDEALEFALDEDVKYVFVHANFNNGFAAQADHSLNVSEEMAQRFADKGMTLIFGHEHQKRHLPGVRIVGNQIPSSIADCKGDDVKQYLRIDDEGIKLVDFLKVSDVYEEVDWRSDTLPEKQFIRVCGEAKYEEAAAVIEKISAWRKQSSAFVITNAVKIGTLDITAPVEDVQDTSFDVWKLILEQIPDDLKEFAQTVKDFE